MRDLPANAISAEWFAPDTTSPETDGPKPEPQPDRRRTKAGKRWEDRHKRRTFHLPRALVAEMEAAVAEDENLSLSGLASEALQEWLEERARP